MASSDSKLNNLLIQLHNRTNEAKEAFDCALAEFEKQKTDCERQYQEKLQRLDDERRKWTEEKNIVEQLAAAASPIIKLNVGGETMTTSRSTLVVAEGTLLATMFSGKWDNNLLKDADGTIFLDYDPMLFKFLLNQLRTWSDPSIKRTLRLPVGSEELFLDFLHLLKFNECLIENKRKPEITNNRDTSSSPQELERFGTVSSTSIQLTDNDRRWKLSTAGIWQYALGTLSYSTGTHRIRIRLENGNINILIGICSRNKLPSGPLFYDKPTTHGWFVHGYVVTNGHGSHPGWPQVKVNDVLELRIDCAEKTVTILNEQSQQQHNMTVNVNDAPFPWCLFILSDQMGSEVFLV